MNEFTRAEIIRRIISTMQSAGEELDEAYALNYILYGKVFDADQAEALFDQQVDDEWDGPHMTTAHVIVTNDEGSAVFFFLLEAWKNSFGKYDRMIRVSEYEPQAVTH
jgi:hypothetical protein